MAQRPYDCAAAFVHDPELHRGAFAAAAPYLGAEAVDRPTRLAEVTLNFVAFRYRPDGLAEEELDELNRRLGDAVLDDGRVYFGTTVYGGKAAFRPAIVNWRTRPADVDLVVPTVLELGSALRPGR